MESRTYAIKLNRGHTPNTSYWSLQTIYETCFFPMWRQTSHAKTICRHVEDAWGMSADHAVVMAAANTASFVWRASSVYDCCFRGVAATPFVKVFQQHPSSCAAKRPEIIRWWRYGQRHKNVLFLFLFLRATRLQAARTTTCSCAVNRNNKYICNKVQSRLHSRHCLSAPQPDILSIRKILSRWLVHPRNSEV